MDVIESAPRHSAQNIAADDSHGYDQAGRWGGLRLQRSGNLRFQESRGCSQLQYAGKYAPGIC